MTSKKRIAKNQRQGLILIAVGLVLMAIFLLYRFHQARILSFWIEGKDVKYETGNREGTLPVYIKSYPLGIDIQVKETKIQNDVWQVFDDAANHLDSSGRIGEKRNIIIYGHNKDDVLGPIRWIKLGAEIELKDSEEKTHIYKVVKTDTIKPDNLEYIKETEEETLTLYTCTGFFDNLRFVVVAKK